MRFFGPFHHATKWQKSGAMLRNHTDFLPSPIRTDPSVLRGRERPRLTKRELAEEMHTEYPSTAVAAKIEMGMQRVAGESGIFRIPAGSCRTDAAHKYAA